MALIKLNSRAIPDSTVVNTDIADGSVTQAKIVDGSISSAKIADDAVTGSKLGIETGRRNVFINGNFDVAQRGTSVTYTSGIWQYLSPDRWMGHFDGPPTGATHHVFDGGPNNGSNKFAEVRGPTSANSGNGAGYFGQRVESASLSGIRAKDSFTVSGWIKRSGSVSAPISTNIICPTATDNFAGYTTHGAVFNSATISGDGTVNNNGTLTLTSVDTWYYFTVTKTSATSLTNFDKGLQLYWAFGGCNNTSDKIQFAQLQLEEGTEATPFEHHSVGEELQLCQRYYYQLSNTTSNPGTDNGHICMGLIYGSRFYGLFNLKQDMRTYPTMTSTSGGFSIFTGISGGTTHTVDELYAPTNQVVRFRTDSDGSLPGVGTPAWLGFKTASAVITLDAEL